MTKRMSRKPTQEQRTLIGALLDDIIEANGRFTVVPPMKASEVCAILDADDGLKRLHGTRWGIVFRDGRWVKLDFNEAVVLLFNYERLRRTLSKHQTELEDGVIEGIKFKFEFSLAVIMKPDIVRKVFAAFHISSNPPPEPPPIAIADVAIKRTKVDPDQFPPLLPIPGLQEDLSDDQLQRIIDLVKLVATVRFEFKVFPPREVTDDLTVLSAPDVTERLINTKWWITIDDSHEELMTFPELLVLTHQLDALEKQVKEAQRELLRSGADNADISIEASFCLLELLQPDSVQYLLGRLRIEGVG